MALGGVVRGHGVDLRPVGGGGGEDLLLVWLSVCINHWSFGAKTGATILLNVARFLAETANNGFRFTVISVSVEATKVRLEQRLPLSEADGVDGLQFLLCEVILLFLSDRRVTGVGGGDGGDGGDSTASFVVLDDLNFLSILHALVACSREAWPFRLP